MNDEAQLHLVWASVVCIVIGIIFGKAALSTTQHAAIKLKCLENHTAVECRDINGR